MKIIINSCYGGFGISPAATLRYNELKGRPCFLFKQENFRGPFVPLTSDECPSLGLFYAFDVSNPPYPLPNDWYQEHDVSIGRDEDSRVDPILIQTVEELGTAANSPFSDLKIIEIPDGVDWEINEYDGIETIHEKHRSWS